MQKQSRVSPFLIILFVCFLLGFLSVFARRTTQNEEASVRPANETSLSGSETDTAPADNTTVAMLIGVDSFSTGNTVLQAVWLLDINQESGVISLVGLPVDLQLAGPSTPSLRELFSLSPSGDVPPTFLETVSLLAPRMPDAYIVLDEVALQQGLDFFGGVELDGDRFSGSQIVRILRLLSDDPPAALKMQAQILEALLPAGSGWDSSLDLNPLLALLPDHAYVSTDVIELTSLALAQLPLSPEQVQIELFLPEP